MTDAGLWVWQLGRSMPSIHTTLGLILSTTHTGYGGPFHPSTWVVEAGRSGVESHPWL